jgi:hypothetical protein
LRRRTVFADSLPGQRRFIPAAKPQAGEKYRPKLTHSHYIIPEREMQIIPVFTYNKDEIQQKSG